MAQQIINVGAAPNDGAGDPIRTSFIKCNNNFGELYSRVQANPPASLVGTAGDQPGMYAYDASYFYYCFANYDGSTIIWNQLTDLGNVTAAQLVSGTSNVRINSPNGNVSFNLNSIANIAVFTTTDIEFNRPLVVSSNINTANINVTSTLAGNVINANTIVSVGNITGSYILGNGSLLTGLPETYANSNVASYLPTYTGNLVSLTGQVTTTSNISGGNIVTGGRVVATGNIDTQNQINATGNITTSGFFVGNFTGNIVGNVVVPGANTDVMFNTNGNIDASSSFTFNRATNALSVLGTISATGNVTTGNISATHIVGTLSTAAQPNITSVGTLTTLSVSGNVNAGNIVAGSGGAIYSTGPITGLNATLIANVTAGNVNTSGNVTGNYFLGNGSLLTGVITTVSNITSGSSNISVTGAGANITVGVGGTGNIVTWATSGEYISGVLSVSGNVTGANFNTGGIVSATGNVIGGNIVANNGGGVVGNSVTANSVSATGNVTGGNVIASSAISAGTTVTATGNVIGGNVTTAGQVVATGNITGGNINSAGTVSAGTLITASILNSGANGTGNIGNSSTYFNTVFAKATSAQYADLAENYTADSNYEPGTVLCFDGDAEVTKCDTDMCVTVAGVVSTSPAYQMNSSLQGEHVVTLALLGRVPVKVLGPVRKGQMLVSAGNGFARAESAPIIGSVIGKALETFNGDQGIIEVVVGRM